MSVDSLDPAGQNPVAADAPVASTPAACCKWKTGLQIPLLLFAAGGLGFAGHQISQSPEFKELLTGQPAISACAYSRGHCCPSELAAQASAASEGCCAAAMADSQACALTNDEIEISEESAGVSALAPANLTPEETDLAVPLVLETL